MSKIGDPTRDPTPNRRPPARLFLTPYLGSALLSVLDCFPIMAIVVQFDIGP